ncbi:MAG: phosphoribosylglycinamide formyltransferase [Gammaproteobacteria bacterium]
MTDSAQPPLPIVVLISGRGSNLQAIIESVTRGDLPVTIRAVISNRASAAGLQHAARAGITTEVVAHTDYPDRTAFDRALQARIDSYTPALVVLAGFMRILTPAFVQHYYGRMLNIHPSLLPEFPGLDTHRRALAAGCTEHGASVHFVTEETDGGPVFLQARVPVYNNDTPDSLAQRVLEQEHRIYPLAIRWFIEGRIFLEHSGQIVHDKRPLQSPKILYPDRDMPC